MKVQIKKYILPFSAVFLSVLFILSFFPFMGGKKNSSGTEILLLNPKDSENLKEVRISKGGTEISFENEGGLWKGFAFSGETENSEKNCFPLDQKALKNALEKISKPLSVCKVSENLSSADSFGLSENLRLSVGYVLDDGREYSIFAGKTDFTRRMTYMILPEKKGIWKIDYDFFEFSHPEIRFWCDPYIFPETLFPPEEKIQLVKVANVSEKKLLFREKNLIPGASESSEKLFSLRHGPIVFEKDLQGKTPLLKITSEYGKGNFISMDFYPENDSEYLIHYHSDSWNFFSHISAWTYSSFIENL